MTYYSDKILAENPIAFYRLNESSGAVATDSSPNSYNGTYSGVTLADTGSPDGSSAPLFDPNVPSYVTLPVAFANALDGAEGTIIAWFKVSDASVWTDSVVREIFQFRVNFSNWLKVEKSSTNNRLTFFYEAGAVPKTINKNSVSDTGWVCVTITWSAGDDEFIAYWNGVVVNTLDSLGVWAGTVTTPSIGSNRGVSQFWDGSLALVAVWDKVLSATVISDLSSTIDPSLVFSPTWIPLELYNIFVYNHTGTLQLILRDWSRLEFHQRKNAPWNHQITLEYGYDDPDLETIRNILPDWLIEVYRTDPVTLVTTKVYEGYNVTIVDQVRANGGIILNLYGVGYTQLLQRRIVEPLTGQEYSTKTDLAETVIKAYVADSMVSPTDTDRIFSGVTVAADTLAGNSITYSARYTNLLSVCNTVSEQGNLDFGIFGGTDVGDFIFDARALWGIDSREENSDGNPPVIFSINRDNMLIPILSNNYSAEQNYMYVGGEGQGADRVIQQVADVIAGMVSPWSRKEAFVESRQQAATSALIATGEAELEARKAKQSLSFNIRQTDLSRWIRDWNLGDLITAKYYTYTFDKQIVDIGVVVRPGGNNYETITARFEDLRL